jgi:hypothetical protein
MKIPYELIITNEVVDEGVNFQEVKGTLHQWRLPNINQRAVWLLTAAKDSEHMFHKWTTILPQNCNNYPVFFGE